MYDTLVHDSNEEDHLKHLKMIFMKIREGGLKLMLSKCAFFKRQVQYLGHLISYKGIYPKKNSLAYVAPPLMYLKLDIGLIFYYRNTLQILVIWSDLSWI